MTIGLPSKSVNVQSTRYAKIIANPFSVGSISSATSLPFTIDASNFTGRVDARIIVRSSAAVRYFFNVSVSPPSIGTTSTSGRRMRGDPIGFSCHRAEDRAELAPIAFLNLQDFPSPRAPAERRNQKQTPLGELE